MKFTIDYLIIGQGLAGSLLAWELQAKGFRVLIVDDNHASAASKVSAGLINPVTGKWMTLSNNYPSYYSAAEKCYQGFEKQLGISIFKQTPIIRVIRNEIENTRYNKIKKNPRYQNYLTEYNQPCSEYPIFANASGYFPITGGASCAIGELVQKLKQYFQNQKNIIETPFCYNELKKSRSEKAPLSWREYTMKAVIFCEGYRISENPWFHWLPFAPAKGEILTIQTDIPFPDAVVHRGFWIVPENSGQFRLGSLYNTKTINCIPSPEGKHKLQDAFDKYVSQPYQVTNHVAGVRPISHDQQPILGQHPKLRHFYIVNGLGSKGALIAPYYIKQFVSFLTRNKDLPKSASITRFPFPG